MLHFRMEATVFLGTLNVADMFLYPSPDLYLDTILSRSSTDNSFDLMVFQDAPELNFESHSKESKYLCK